MVAISEEYTIWTVIFLIYLFGILIHGIGLYVIVNCKKKLNQSLILFNLSILELICIVYSFINTIINIIIFERNIAKVDHNHQEWTKIPEKFKHLNWAIYFSLILEYFCIMITLTIDRLIRVMNPISYRSNITKFRLTIVLTTTWTFTALFAVLYTCYPNIYHVMLIGFIGIGSLYLIAVIAVYSLIIYRLAKSSRALQQRNSNQTQRARKFKKHYLIPGLIILSFGIFCITPYIVSKFHSPEDKKQYIIIQIMYALMGISFINDPIIYVFMTIHYRKVLDDICANLRRRLLCWCTNNKSIQNGRRHTSSTNVFTITTE